MAISAFVIYNPTTGAISSACTANHPDDIATIMAANTPAGMAALAVDATEPVLYDQRNWAVIDGALTAVVPTDAALLAAAQTAQVRMIDSSYQSQINNGFASSALGSSYIYPVTETDQANLNAVVTMSMIPSQPSDWTTVFLCAPAATPTVWSYATHTIAQIHQVATDGYAYVMAMKMQRAERDAQIQAATTVDAVQAVVW